LQHVTPAGVVWPIAGFRKPQHIKEAAPTKLRAPNQTCVLIRRFSAKEDKQRLVACAYRGGEIPGKWLGLENHLNFIYRPDGQMEFEEALGLARLLNSPAYDDYFRVCNGNTQVGATEIRELPLPPLDTLRRLSTGTGPLTPTDSLGSLQDLP
jgi:adenine-specific DNA-methyltransferase